MTELLPVFWSRPGPHRLPQFARTPGRGATLSLLESRKRLTALGERLQGRVREVYGSGVAFERVGHVYDLVAGRDIQVGVSSDRAEPSRLCLASLLGGVGADRVEA
jgi:hypothetical protein